MFLAIVLLASTVSASTAIAPQEGVQKAQNEPRTLVQLVHDSSIKYGVSEVLMTKIIKCESGFNPRAYNPQDPNGGSFGILQFQKTTWDYYSTKYGIENPDIWNPEQQIEVGTRLVSEGRSFLWTCGRKYDNPDTR